MFKNLIFDWSGTLVDDLDLVIDATNTVFTHYGLAPLDKPSFRRHFRLPYPEFYADWLPDVPLDELENVFRHGFDISTAKVTLLPHALEFTDFCQAQGIRCFALTSVDPPSFYEQVRDVGLEGFFEHSYPGAINKKLVIHDLLATHGLSTDETAYIGDMTHDIETAAHAGITSIGVLTGYQSAAQLAPAQPDALFEHLGILRKFLSKEA